MKKYFEKYTYVNCLLTVMVVLRHSITISWYDLSNTSFTAVVERGVYCMTGLAVVLFFILSAFNFFQDYNENNVKEKLQRRVKSLVVLYIIAVSINWVLYAILPKIPILNNYVNGSIYQLNFWSYLHTLLTGGGTPLWFLRNLIILTFLNPLIYNVIKYKVGFFSLLAGEIILWELFPQDQFSLIYSFGAYLMGTGIALYWKNFMIANTDKRKALLFIFFILCGVDFGFEISDIERIRLPYTIIIALLFWKVIKSTPNRCTRDNDNRIYNIKRYNFLIFCYHYFVLDCIKKINYIMFGNCETGALINFIVSPLVCMCLLYIVFLILEKNMPRTFNIVSGNRG